MRTVHRIVAVLAVLFGLYVGATGVMVQSMDLWSILGRAPATDPTMQAIRVGHDGPPNFQVIREPDYLAQALPRTLDPNAALSTVMTAARATLGDAPVSFVELRMADGRPVGQVVSKGLLRSFDATTGAALGAPSKFKLPPLSTPSLRNTIKDVHRMRVYSEWALILDALVGVLLLTMIVTGFIVYVRLLTGRARMGRKNPFWSAGGVWKTLHRAVAISAALFLTIIASSGMVLALSSTGVAVNKALHGGKRPGLTADVSSPLRDAELPDMLGTTLAAYSSAEPGGSVRVIRLRYFASMPQGVIVTGGEPARQLVFNANTGRPASETEPGYPSTDMTFGWQIDQIAKQIHRGDIIGLSGRWTDLLSGLSLIYLTVSGAVIYFDLWNKRRQKGRRALFWT
jgi:uncharacterized iron-regulated membrane protein